MRALGPYLSVRATWCHEAFGGARSEQRRQRCIGGPRPWPAQPPRAELASERRPANIGAEHTEYRPNISVERPSLAESLAEPTYATSGRRWATPIIDILYNFPRATSPGHTQHSPPGESWRCPAAGLTLDWNCTATLVALCPYPTNTERARHEYCNGPSAVPIQRDISHSTVPAKYLCSTRLVTTQYTETTVEMERGERCAKGYVCCATLETHTAAQAPRLVHLPMTHGVHYEHAWTDACRHVKDPPRPGSLKSWPRAHSNTRRYSWRVFCVEGWSTHRLNAAAVEPE